MFFRLSYTSLDLLNLGLGIEEESLEPRSD